MKKVLIIIDMQNDFITGSLGSEEGQKIVDSVVEKIKNYKEKNDFIICTRDTHKDNYLKTQEGKKLPVVHCIENTKGWEIVEEISKNLPEDTLIFNKGQFASPELALYLKEFEKKEGIEEIEVVGVVTSICVISNVLTLKGFLPEKKIVIDSRCTASVGQEDYEAALLVMKMCQVDII